MRARSWLCLAALSIFVAPAHAIPPPPPDPAAVTEAGKLADELLVDLDESGVQYQARMSVCRDAMSWLDTVHPDVQNPYVRNEFYAAIGTRVDAVWPEERANVNMAVANQLRFLPATDLMAVRAFIASAAGQNFARMLAGSNFGLADRVASQVVYRRVFPEFSGLLAAAQKSAAD